MPGRKPAGRACRNIRPQRNLRPTSRHRATHIGSCKLQWAGQRAIAYCTGRALPTRRPGAASVARPEGARWLPGTPVPGKRWPQQLAPPSRRQERERGSLPGAEAPGNVRTPSGREDWGSMTPVFVRPPGRRVAVPIQNPRPRGARLSPRGVGRLCACAGLNRLAGSVCPPSPAPHCRYPESLACETACSG